MPVVASVHEEVAVDVEEVDVVVVQVTAGVAAEPQEVRPITATSKTR